MNRRKFIKAVVSGALMAVSAESLACNAPTKAIAATKFMIRVGGVPGKLFEVVSGEFISLGDACPKFAHMRFFLHDNNTLPDYEDGGMWNVYEFTTGRKVNRFLGTRAEAIYEAKYKLNNRPFTKEDERAFLDYEKTADVEDK